MNDFSERTNVKKRWLILVAAISALVCVLSLSSVVTADTPETGTTGTEYGHFYYDQLDDYKKQIYDKFDSMTVEDPSFTLDVTDIVGKPVSEIRGIVDDVSEVFTLYKEENLYKYWLGTKFSYGYTYFDGKVTSSRITITAEDLMTEYGSTSSEIDANVIRIKEVINGFSDGIDTTSTFTKVQSIHSIVVGLLEYDHTMPETMVPRNVATAFLGGSFENPSPVVCEGYAKAFKAMCDVYGVPCVIVTGLGNTVPGGEGENHMWNYVKMDDGKWYLVDCTWDDQSYGIITYYMLAGSETIPFGGMAVKDSHLIDSAYDRFGMALSDTLYPRPANTIRLQVENKDYAILYYNAGDSVRVPYVPVKAATETFSYVFDHWESGSATVIELPTVTGDAEYNAVFHSLKNKYTVIFKDNYGTIYSETQYSAGDTITIPTASRDTDGYAMYTFEYWSLDGKTKIDIDGHVTSDITYIAVYKETVRHYSISFKDYNGTLISSDTYTFNTPIIPPADPAREMTNEFVYSFKGWNNDINGNGEWFDNDPVTGDTTYYAVYDRNDRNYVVKIIGTDGKLLCEQNYHYNEKFRKPDGFLYIEWYSEPPTYVTSDSTYRIRLCATTASADTLRIDSESNTASIPSELVPRLNGDSGITFVLSNATVAFDAEAARNLSAGQTLQVYKRSFDSLSESVRSDLGNAYVYEISFGTNDSVFGSGTVTVSTPYVLARGQSASDIRAFYVEGSVLNEVQCVYENGTVSFTTNHFSTYAITYPDESVNPLTIIEDNLILIGILLFAIIGIALTYRFSRA